MIDLFSGNGEKMKFVRLSSAAGGLYEDAINLYRDSFPLHEQREAEAQAGIMEKEAYQFNLIYEEKEPVGLLLCWETDSFIYVEHFCISPGMRNRRYGRRALDLLCRRSKTVILEIDPPVDEISTRRKGFYERAGFHPNRFVHIHPPYHKEYSGHSLEVMSYPAVLTDSMYQEFYDFLKKIVMET